MRSLLRTGREMERLGRDGLLPRPCCIMCACSCGWLAMMVAFLAEASLVEQPIAATWMAALAGRAPLPCPLFPPASSLACGVPGDTLGLLSQ